MITADGRAVVWFSCGAASAVAAKIAVQQHYDVHVVYCDTLSSENKDNERFFNDVQEWIGHRIEKIHSDKFIDIDDVFEKTKYMAGIRGARCTIEMKKMPRLEFQRPNDLHIFGLTADEKKRIIKFEGNNPDLELEWNLRDLGITKKECYRRVADAGIKLPVMYQLGFKNNNCIGCVKATSAKYWFRTRQFFPDTFQKRAQQSRKLGVRLVRYHGKRIFLDELPEVNTDYEPELDIECGPVCVTGENDDLKDSPFQVLPTAP